MPPHPKDEARGLLGRLFRLARRLPALRHERRRARKRLRMLEEADIIVLSLGKSGRTWVRVMISHLYHQRFGVPEDQLLGFADFHAQHPSIPRILFTHDLPSDPWNRWRRGDAEPFAGKRVLLLVRDPRDVAVSMYFHHAKRARPATRARLRLPEDMTRDLSVAEFMLGSRGRVRFYARDLNAWAARLRGLPGSLIVRYEDLRADPAAGLARIAAFLGGGFTPEELRQAAAFAAFENMQALESRGFFGHGRLSPGDAADPDSFKVRRGEVGGYRSHLSPEQAAAADAVVANDLDRAYGYS